MEPDKVLLEMRQAIREWELAESGSRAEQEAAERATSAAGALDDWLSRGGFLPAAWQVASREIRRPS